MDSDEERLGKGIGTGTSVKTSQSEPVIHKTLSHFRIIEKLGERGMGVACKA